MEELHAALKYLEERGITAHRTAQGAYRCGSAAADDMLDIILRNGRWQVSRWDTAPGPGANDFITDYAVLDEALLAIWSYFFAQPLILGGWIIPFHRHPYWSLSKLQYRLAMLVQISELRFEAIRDERAGRLVSQLPINLQERLGMAEQVQFFSFHHAHQSRQRLAVRRDLAEAYIVIDED